MEYYLSMKKTNADTNNNMDDSENNWNDSETTILLSNRSEIQRNVYCVIPLIYNSEHSKLNCIA